MRFLPRIKMNDARLNYRRARRLLSRASNANAQLAYSTTRTTIASTRSLHKKNLLSNLCRLLLVSHSDKGGAHWVKTALLSHF